MIPWIRPNQAANFINQVTGMLQNGNKPPLVLKLFTMRVE
jgi:hypothetical protein